MKIYEVRDITDEEVYYVKAFFLTAKEAIEALMDGAEGISESPEDSDCVIGAVFEHEIGVWGDNNSFGKKIFEAIYTNTYIEDTDEYAWKSEITKEYVEHESGK